MARKFFFIPIFLKNLSYDRGLEFVIFLPCSPKMKEYTLFLKKKSTIGMLCS